MKKYKKAFTLAEVLIVLGVIGVVSALTIPNLKDNTSDQVNVARAKKVYSELETAYDRTTLKYGNQYNWTTTGTNNAVTSAKDNAVVLYNRIKNYLDVKKARNEDLYLCITESKKKSGFEEEAPMFEKHKVFLYKEDFK